MNHKIIPLIPLSFLFFYLSCIAPDHIPKQVNYYGFDFTKYSAQNFLFTPEKYNGEYESIGILTVEIFPEVSKVRQKAKDAYYPWEGSAPSWYTAQITAEEILDSLYYLSRDMGADAVINLHISKTEKNYQGLIIEGLNANGFAIKRK